MKEEEPVQGFNDYKESLFAKLIPAIDELVLVRMKLDQLKAKGMTNDYPVMEEFKTETLKYILAILNS